MMTDTASSIGIATRGAMRPTALDVAGSGGWIGRPARQLEDTMEPIQLTVTDIRQYHYCPRVVYYTYVQPLERPVTFKMEHGQAAEEREREREVRRTLYRYGLGEGEREFDVALSSRALGLSGRVDMLVTTHTEIVPIEFKYTNEEPSENHCLQVTAYAMIAESRYSAPVPYGIICRLPDGATWRVEANSERRKRVQELVDDIRNMIEHERFPDPPADRAKCVDCEFRRFCADF
jgi:CRISPR-associated exonuclease Cas4